MGQSLIGGIYPDIPLDKLYDVTFTWYENVEVSTI